MILRKIILALLWPLLTTCGSNYLMAQDFNEHNFTHYTRQQGLSGNNITGLRQDSAGYMWIATSSGLNRFNGSSFVQFHGSDDSISIPTEYLRGLVWLDKRRLGANTDGLHIIDTYTGTTRNLFVPYSNKQYQYKFNYIMSVSSNAAGDIFLLTRSGFYHFNKDYQLIFRFDYYKADEVPNTSFVFGRKSLWLDSNRLVIFSTEGIYQYDTGIKKFKKMEAVDCPQFQEFLGYPKTNLEFFQQKKGCFFIMNFDSDSLIYLDINKHIRTAIALPFPITKEEFAYRSDIFSLNDSTLCITGHTSGFFKLRFYPASGRIDFHPEKYFASYFCRQIFPDKDNNLWIATNKGVFRQDNRWSHLQQAHMPAALEATYPNITITDITTTRNKLYLATIGNGGLLVFDKKSLDFTERISFRKYWQGSDNIFSLVNDKTNNLLLGTNGPMFRLNLSTNETEEISLDKWNRSTDWIGSLIKSRNDEIWLASGNIYRYNWATHTTSLVALFGKPLDKIDWPRSMREDSAGNIWIGGHGLLRYNITSKTFDRLVDSFPFIKIPNRQINTFIADNRNNLWINSDNNGLTSYNIDSETFRHFTRDNGLPDNNIASMAVVRDKLWLATYSGIACLDLKTFKITSFGIEDGFPDQPIVKGSMIHYDSIENKLFIGFTNVIVKFDPDVLLQKSKPPHAFIEQVATDNRNVVFPGKEVTTSWRNNAVTVTIGSINYFTGNGQRFAYQLEQNNNKGWQQLGNRNTFSISNLSPGTHLVWVKLFSINNRWPEQISEFKIIITPPFWKETWFITASAVVFLFIIYRFFKWRTGNIRRKEQAKTHIEKLKAQEYKNQYELEQITNYFSSSMAGKKNVNDVLWDVTKNLIGRMNYEDCIIYMWNEDKTRMLQKAAFGPKGNLKASDMEAFDVLPGQGLVGHVIQTREPLLVGDTRTDSRYRVDDMARLSELCVPIILDNELIGIIDSEHPNANHFQERDIKILTTIATLVGNRIKQIESDQMLEIKQKEITLINLQLAEAQLSALQAQMNPHFIFNSLNSIKGMILDNEQQKASRYLSKFATMIRITLNQSKEVFTTLYENIEHLESYLMMEKLRFDDSFTFQFRVDEAIDKEETLIPTLMLQPLAENAIWHGLMHRSGEKILVISFTISAGTICCNIEDNGIGIRKSEQLKQVNNPHHHSVGLNNLRNRIKILNEKYDAGCTFEINDLSDLDTSKTGTRAVLCFNIINKPFL